MTTKKKPDSVKAAAVALKKAVNYHKKEIGRHRDALRELIYDASAIADTCDEAFDELDHAVETLSQYV
jgi:hypothetical protein